MTPGQAAYEADALLQPLYHDGQLRKPWSRLSDAVKDSWERQPTPRNHNAQSSTRADAGQLAAGASNEAQDACIGRVGHSLSRRDGQ